jgi:hypothetical protein
MESKTLKKGTARLALLALKEGITNLEIVLPASIILHFQNPKDSIHYFNASFKPETLTKTQAAFYNCLPSC